MLTNYDNMSRQELLHVCMILNTDYEILLRDRTKRDLFLKWTTFFVTSIQIYIVLEQKNVDDLCNTTKILTSSIGVCVCMCVYIM